MRPPRPSRRRFDACPQPPTSNSSRNGNACMPSAALSLLRWDAAVMMPRGSADVRGEQLAAIETEQHSLLTSPRVTRLLERAQANAAILTDWQLANLRQMRRQRDRAIATPASLIQRLARA